MRKGIGMAVVMMIASPLSAARDQAPASAPAPVASLFQCRQLADPTARLACFDRETAAVESAYAKRELSIVGKAQVRQARRELFGFMTPSFAGLFGDAKDDEMTEVATTVTAIGRTRDGGWILRTADTGTWEQNDDKPLALAPQRGSKLLIKRALLGSYMIRVDGQPAFKARRVQ